MSNFTTDNLIPYEGALKPGQRLLRRLDGSFLPIGVQGGTQVASTDFYKCASVDTSTQTWTGYLYDKQTLSFSSEAVNLIYTSKSPPVSGKYYTEDGEIVADPYSQAGMIFYAPMTSSFSKDELGTSLTNNNVTFTTSDGVACAYFPGSGSSSRISTGFKPALGTGPWSFSAFCKCTSYSTSNGTIFFMVGMYSGGAGIGLGITTEGGVYIMGVGVLENQPADISAWFHVAASYSNGTVIAYINGVSSTYSGEITVTHTSSEGLQIGRSTTSVSWGYLTGYVRDLRLYNRVISETEVLTEYNRLSALVTA